jgi:uncharacterized protein YceH (UPF0502 family)
MLEEPEQDAPPITELSKSQRRVLGTLLEKAFTTPEAYPLTVKALTAGCNQKSNRHPLTEYSEDDVLEVLDQLRQMGLAAVVHTETGRTERFRHYMRKRFTFTEPQLAVLTELLLRGRQSIGDLRARASRMVPIESLDELRTALRGLLEQKYVQATGELERRGVEVDHNFYAASEHKKLDYDARVADDEEPPRAETLPQRHVVPQSQAAPAAVMPQRGPNVAESPASSAALSQLRDENVELRGRIDSLEHEVGRLKSLVDDLVRDLRG